MPQPPHLPPVDRSESRPILWPIYNATARPTHSRKAYLNTSAGAGAGYAVSDSRSSARRIIDGCCRSFVLLQGQRMQRYSDYLSWTFASPLLQQWLNENLCTFWSEAYTSKTNYISTFILHRSCNPENVFVEIFPDKESAGCSNVRYKCGRCAVSRVSPYTTALQGADCGVRRGVCFHFNHLCTLTMSYNGLPGGQRCGARDRTEVASLEAKRRKVKTMDLLYKVKSKVDVYILKFTCTYWAIIEHNSNMPLNCAIQ